MTTAAAAPQSGARAVDRLTREITGFMRALHALKTCLPDSASYRSSLLLLPKMAEGTCRLRTLAEAVHADPSTVSRQVSELVDLGLVRREADPKDGRATLLAITTEGRSALDDLRRRRSAVLESILADWPPEQVNELSDLLHAFSVAVGDRTRDDMGVRPASPGQQHNSSASDSPGPVPDQALGRALDPSPDSAAGSDTYEQSAQPLEETS